MRHMMLLYVLATKSYVNEKNRIKYTSEHYLKNDIEMSELFSDIPEALRK